MGILILATRNMSAKCYRVKRVEQAGGINRIGGRDYTFKIR